MRRGRWSRIRRGRRIRRWRGHRRVCRLGRGRWSWVGRGRRLGCTRGRGRDRGGHRRGCGPWRGSARRCIAVRFRVLSAGREREQQNQRKGAGVPGNQPCCNPEHIHYLLFTISLAGRPGFRQPLGRSPNVYCFRTSLEGRGVCGAAHPPIAYSGAAGRCVLGAMLCR